MADVPVSYYNSSSTSDAVAIKNKWWEAEPEAMHQHVFGVVKRIKQNQNYRTINNLRYARLYSNMELMGLQAGMYARSNDSGAFLQNRVTYNVIKSCIDTAAAKIAKDKPKPYFLTDGGDWNLQRRAMRMNKYMLGLFDNIGTGDADNRTMYGLGRRAFVDSAVFGTGATKFYIEDDTVKAERVLIEEIIVDDTEGRYEQPRQMHQEKLVFREVLLDMFPGKRAEILACPSGLYGEQDTQSSADMVAVIESWHLPSGKEATDGKKVITIENATLSDPDQMEWKKDYFPFLFQRWCPRVIGFYGCGLAEELIGIQLEINKLLRNIQLSQHLMAVPQVWINVASKVVGKHINNEVGGIKYYSGEPPKFFVPQAMSAEVYQHLETLYNKAFQITGVSQLSAASQKPAGLTAAVALREMQDIESERFSLVSLRNQDWYMDATNICTDLLDDIAASGKNPAYRIKDGENSYVAKWSEVRIPKENYTIRPWPVNLLPDTPAGKLSTAQEMIQAGFWSKEEAMDVLDFPDTKAVISLETAQRRDLRRMIELIIDKAEYQPPEPFINLQMAKSLSQSYYLWGRTEGMPEERLELLRRFMEDVQAMIDAAKPPPAEPMPDQGGMPAEAVPQAAPTSDLLPIGQ